MTETHDPGSEPTEALGLHFADAIESVLEAASSMFPIVAETEVTFSVALAGEAGKSECENLLLEMPVFAEIPLSEDLGRGAAILIDVSTASMLVGLVSGGEPAGGDTLSEDDITSLHSALVPVLDAISATCEVATGKPFGLIEKIEVIVPEAAQEVIERLPESLCRATASVHIAEQPDGRIGILLPTDLARAMAEAEAAAAEPESTPYEPTELDDVESMIADLEAKVEMEPAEEAPVEMAPTAEAQSEREPTVDNLHLVLDIQLELSARLGQVEMPIGEILKLAPGSVIDIDRFAEEPVELVVNDRPIARGEIVVVQENFGIKITEISSPKERIESLR